MAETSDFVLRWEIDNAAARFATGNVESEVFEQGGFKWNAIIKRDADYNANFSLNCGVDHAGSWKCEANVDRRLLKPDGTFSSFKKKSDFNKKNRVWLFRSVAGWDYITTPTYCIHGKVTLEFHINIITSEGGQTIGDMFSAPNRKSNVILKIGEKKLHVCKEFLAVHSPVLDTLFFGDFAEKGKDEVELKDVVYEEFLDLLNLLHFGTMEITDRTVPHILKLSDEFQIERIFEHSKKYLTQSKGIDVMKKLLLADRYNIAHLKDHCLQSFTNSRDLSAKLKSPEYASLSGDMKIAICDRIAEL